MTANPENVLTVRTMMSVIVHPDGLLEAISEVEMPQALKDTLLAIVRSRIQVFRREIYLTEAQMRAHHAKDLFSECEQYNRASLASALTDVLKVVHEKHWYDPSTGDERPYR